MGNRREIIDVSHAVEDGMITYKGLPAPVICDYLSREESRSHYAEGTEFHIDKIEIVANTGTYVDAPFHRFAVGKDLSELPLGSLADLETIIVRSDQDGERAIGRDRFEDLGDLVNKAVLVNTGRDANWRTDRYRRPSLPSTRGSRVPGGRGRGPGGDRLAEHRRHRRRQAAGAYDASRYGYPHRRAPPRLGPPSGSGLQVLRRTGEDKGLRKVSGEGVWSCRAMSTLWRSNPGGQHA